MPAASVSVVVPVYRAEATLRELARRVAAVLDGLGADWELVFVDDGSPDDSGRVVAELAAEEARVVPVALARNFGQHNALLAGIRRASKATIVTMDDDLQHAPEDLPQLLTALERDGLDVVYGYAHRQEHSAWRVLASKLTRVVLSTAMGVPAARHVSAYRAFRAELREAFATYSGAFVSIDVLLSWGTTRFGMVEVESHPRAAGESNYTLGKLVRHAADMLTGFSTLPLQLASLTGFAFTLFGIAALAWVVGRYLVLGYSVPGFPFLASLIAVLAGAQLFALGVIGEYLARMHFRLMGKPTYVVRERGARRP